MSDWRVTSTVGGKFSKVHPVFSPDRKHFLVLTSLELRVYLLASKQCIRSMPVENSNKVVDLYAKDDCVVWIARENGQCDVVNWMDRQVVETISLDLPLLKILKTDSKVMAITEGKNKHGFDIVSKKDKLKQHAHCKTAKLVAVSNNRQYYAFFSASQKHGDTLIVGNISTGERKTFNRHHGLSALAVADNGTVAAGSVTGVIDLYYEPFKDSCAVRALKWHVDSVLSLCFSLDNNYLLSGGKEKVLVFWQLETDNTQFLPRLDGEIQNIIVDSASEMYALSLGNDQVLVLSAVDLISRLQVAGIKAKFERLPNDPEKERRRRKKLGLVDDERVGDYTSMFAIHPKSKHVVLPANISSQLQIYDLQRDDQVKVMSVAAALQTGKVKQEENIQDASIQHVCFSRDGTWMVTVDEQTNPSIDRLMSRDDKSVQLKFWHYEKSSWHLSTRVASPHGTNKSILSVIAQPTGHGFVTASEDGGVRLWRPSPDSKRGTIAWSVRKILAASGTTSSAVSVALSPDGSVLLLGFETSIYVVDTQKFEIQTALPNFLGGRVRNLHFASPTLLVALSKTRLVVWDLIKDSAQWSVAVASPQNGRRLLAVENGKLALGINHFDNDWKTVGKVFVFDAKSPFPVHVEYHDCAVAGVANVPNTGNFVFMDTMGRVSTLSSGPVMKQQQQQKQQTVMTEMAHLYHMKHKQQEEQLQEQLLPEGQARVLNINSFDTVFDGQSEYSLDTLESLFDKVLNVVS